MKIKKYNSNIDWDIKLPVCFLSVYFFVLFPLISIVFREQRWVAQYAYPCFFLLSIVFLFVIKNIPFQGLGLSNENLKQNIFLGLLSGGAVLSSIPLIDTIIDISGLASSELFIGAELRVDNSQFNLLNTGYLLFSILIFTTVEHTFFSGFVLQSLLQKFKPMTAIYISAILFTIAHFHFSLGGLIIGMTTAFMYYKTGTIYAGVLFQVSCELGGILVQSVYPRLATFQVFFN